MRRNHPSLVGYWWFIALGIGLIGFKMLVFDRMHTCFRHPKLRPDGTVPGVEHDVGRSFADGLDLIGYDQSEREMPADDALRIDLYWTVRHQPSRRYQTVVHLVGPAGLRWSPRDSFRPTDYQSPPPTTSWRPGTYAIDSHEIEPLSGTPPGQYEVVLTVFERETLAPISVLSEQGHPAAPELTLGRVTLDPPQQRVEPDSLDMRHRLDVELGPLTLLRAGIDRKEAVPGDSVYVTTFWLTEEGPREDLTLLLTLLAPGRSSVADYVLSPVAPWYPTSSWSPGDVWRGQHVVTLPAELDTGVYTWTLYLSPQTTPSVTLAQLSVTAPSRTFTPPPVDVDVGVTLGDVATLVGANRSPPDLTLEPGSVLSVTLVWRAEAETDVSYRVFLHLSDEQGNPVAQSDGVPDEWKRPTTGWVPGEIITDARTLAIPEDAPQGDYTLVAGLYGLVDGRLTEPAGGDAVYLGIVRVDSP